MSTSTELLLALNRVKRACQAAGLYHVRDDLARLKVELDSPSAEERFEEDNDFTSCPVCESMEALAENQLSEARELAQMPKGANWSHGYCMQVTGARLLESPTRFGVLSKAVRTSVAELSFAGLTLSIGGLWVLEKIIELTFWWLEFILASCKDEPK